MGQRFGVNPPHLAVSIAVFRLDTQLGRAGVNAIHADKLPCELRAAAGAAAGYSWYM
jgi:hypothetical protein